ncbi:MULTISPECIES: ParB N-terminal domain-containing protein [Nostoc]|uniref:ParB N-terminal domain-containing protein n=1 Tax=Nostoc paludosum FACHB-159 TaxID=2692908 RepID=A0ABR8KKC6_9NOSO|nr:MULTISPECIES: ParB N-terminal domain-containing protein [Nostoc]MBD2682947.1 ParB N-terminal domain-containing protein [Nostoc sp. FACHB-857]MBD2739286.1 ParB N-terminal domain-containing protein [Nostoc paludosum FACHB-159]
MGRLESTSKATTNQRIANLKQILNFTPGLEENEVNQGESTQDSSVVWVKRSQIHLTFSFVPDGQPVRYYYDPEELEAWALNDLKPNGIHSPLWVRPLKNGNPDEYELVAGKRRYHGSEFAQIDPLPVRIFNWNDIEAFKASLAENKNRRDFSALEDLDAILKLLAISIEGTVEEAVSLLYQMDNLKRRSGIERVLAHPQYEIIQAIFDFFGGISWESFVKSRLPLLKKPQEILQAVRQGKIEYTKGLEIAKIKEPKIRQKLLEKAIVNKLPLAEIKKLTQSHKPSSQNSIQSRFDLTYKEFRKSLKKIENNPEQLQKAQNLLFQIEEFVKNN